MGYYWKEVDRQKLFRFLRYASKESNRSSFILFLQMHLDSVRYNISLIEYFLFGFYKNNRGSKKEWAGTGYMYEYQLRMNPRNSRDVLSDKAMFLKEYGKWVSHPFLKLEEAKRNPSLLQPLIESSIGKIVIKSVDGQCGRGVEVLSTDNLKSDELLLRMEDSGNDLAEAFVQQHPELDHLSSSGLNTLRLITQLDPNNEVVFLGARLRITVNSHVDNLAAGNLAAPVDLETGVVNGSAVYSDIEKPPVDIHPVTGVPIKGFKVPWFKEALQMVKEAALHNTRNRSIGWDVAITESGPDLIEGNHDWCKLLWQLPVQKGLKSKLEKFK